jgi:hypothetical protein
LRQCDGEHAQCVVLVRDDFWLAVSRFLGELNIELFQGQNAALVDVFDLRHARKVLAAFGLAFGSVGTPPTKENDAFLDQALSGLAQDGRVISVRLALFAEMVKSKTWAPATLKEVGGAAGVGVNFLEETFAASTAAPPHRQHQRAAQGVLKALLPEAGSDIKGHMKSHEELLEASGYAGRRKDFDDLLRILDGELRLITPTEPEGGDERPRLAPGEKPASAVAGSHGGYYQLTHDYLVPSLRDWLTRKQKETRRGRAELLLADRAAVWAARREQRQLPSLWQWLRIRLLTQKRNWTLPQRTMMRKATQYHVLRGAALAVLAAVLAMAGLGIWDRVEERNHADHAAGLVQQLLRADIAQVPGIVAEIGDYRTWADPLLKQEYAQAGTTPQAKLHLSLALLPVDSSQQQYLVERLFKAAPGEVAVLRDALAPYKSDLLPTLWAAALKPAAGQDQPRLRPAAALAEYDPSNPRWAEVQAQVADELVAVPAVHLGIWMDCLHQVSGRLQKPLVVVFRDSGRRQTERERAAEILRDYAGGQPDVLADLLMDADEQQFTVLFPKLAVHAQRSISLLDEELGKRVTTTPTVQLRQETGTITKGAPPVKVEGLKDSLPAKVFPIEMKAGKSYTITMRSKELDAYLVLKDKNGKQLGFDDDSGGGQDALLIYTATQDGDYSVYAAALERTGSFSLTIEEGDSPSAVETHKETLAKRQANAAVALLRMNRTEKVCPLLKHSPDPRVRGYLIDRLGPLGADVHTLVKHLDEETDVTIRRALLLSLGEFGPDAWSAAQRTELVGKVKELYETADDAGVHAAAEWLLRQPACREEQWLHQTNEAWAKEKEAKRLDRIKQILGREKDKAGPLWYVNRQSQTMVVLAALEPFVMGAPVYRDFSLAAAVF